MSADTGPSPPPDAAGCPSAIPASGPQQASRYVRAVLDAYRRAPGTTGHLRPADRRLARDLYERGVAVGTVLDALLLASARRFAHATPASQPAKVRSFAYFRDIIEELLRAPLDASYRQYLARTLERSVAARTSSR